MCFLLLGDDGGLATGRRSSAVVHGHGGPEVALGIVAALIVRAGALRISRQDWDSSVPYPRPLGNLGKARGGAAATSQGGEQKGDSDVADTAHTGTSVISGNKRCEDSQ